MIVSIYIIHIILFDKDIAVFNVCSCSFLQKLCPMMTVTDEDHRPSAYKHCCAWITSYMYYNSYSNYLIILIKQTSREIYSFFLTHSIDLFA